VKRIVVHQFGDSDQLQLHELDTPAPGRGEVLIRVTAIGVNYADIMARRGQYKLVSGEPPFTPGLEAGGVIEAVGEAVPASRIGERATLSLQAPRGAGVGTYADHYVCPSADAITVPPGVPDDQLGSLWLTYLTAWSCLIHTQGLQPGTIVGLPAASSGVALAAAQIVRAHGGTTIGLTTSPGKVEQIEALPHSSFDHIVVTAGKEGAWGFDLKALTNKHGIDVFFDPVAAGAYLDTEIKSLAKYGTIWVYGLLGQTGPVDVTPLIRKHAAIRGWSVAEFAATEPEAAARGYQHILDRMADGSYAQHIHRRFPLADAADAHTYMEQSSHIGKIILQP